MQFAQAWDVVVMDVSAPAREVNTNSLTTILKKMERQPGETARLFRGISGYSPIFQDAADAILEGNKVAK